MDLPVTPRENVMTWLKDDTRKLIELIKNGTTQKYRSTSDIIARYPQFAKYGSRRVIKKIVYLKTYKPVKTGIATLEPHGEQRQQQQQQQQDGAVVVEKRPKGKAWGNGRVKHERTSIVSTPFNKKGHAFTPSSNVKMNLMHMSHMWMNIDSHEYITIQMNLPSGINIHDIDRVLQVNCDGMNVTIIIDWPIILTDSNIIQSGWERTNSTLTEDMKRQMFQTIDSNILQLKERLHIPLSECIRGECKIPLEKECSDDVVDMCVHHEGTHGGLVLYITTKVRALSNQAIRKKIQVTCIPPSRGVTFNNSNSNIDTNNSTTGMGTTTTGKQQHSNAPATFPHSLPAIVLTDPLVPVVVPQQMNDQHADETTSLQEEGDDIQTTSGKKIKMRSSIDDTNNNSVASSNEYEKVKKKHRKDNITKDSNNSDDHSYSSAELSVDKKKVACTTTENTSTADSNNGNDDDDDDNGTTTNNRTNVTDLVEGILQVGQEKKPGFMSDLN